jgi:two-component system alkaline phosphatase synthesis response regulator PhoP
LHTALTNIIHEFSAASGTELLHPPGRRACEVAQKLCYENVRGQLRAMAKQTILIIEDDTDIVELVQYNLERDGLALLVANDGEAGLTVARERLPALILLDLMLPGMEGLEVCRHLKRDTATSSIPLIMLTAKGDETDIVLGLGLGADDYVTKPFSPKQLIARIRAVLRRGVPREVTPTPLHRLRQGALTVDADRHEVRVDGEPVSLTVAEFRLLHTLAAHPERVFTRDQLLDKITKGESVIIDRNVDVHVRAIRKKLGVHGDCIVTVRGVGYKCRE